MSIVARSADPYQDFLNYESEMEFRRKMFPVCRACKEPIQEDYYEIQERGSNLCICREHIKTFWPEGKKISCKNCGEDLSKQETCKFVQDFYLSPVYYCNECMENFEVEF